MQRIYWRVYEGTFNVASEVRPAFSMRCASRAFVLRRRYCFFADSTEEYPERVVRLVRESRVIDMLNILS